jgi:hypothetical protein
MSLPRLAPNQYQPQNDARSPGFTLVPQGRPLGRPAIVQPQPQTSFDAVRSAVNALKDEEAGEIADPVEDIAPPVRSQPVRTTRSAASQPARPPRQTPAQANPSRAWVQVATGSNRAGLIFTYGQFRRRAGALLSGRAPYSAPNRLLVGPFPTEAAASSFARQLNARGVPSHSWTSDAGQRIDQLQAAADDDTPATTRTRTRTAANERSSGTRSPRGTSSRNERNGTSRNGTGRTERNGAGRNERSAGNGNGRNRNGAPTGRTGNSRNERTAGTNNRNGTGNGSRNGRNGTGNSRTAGAGNGTGRNSSGRTAGRGGKPPATASTRTSRGGSGGQSRSSTRRGR